MKNKIIKIVIIISFLTTLYSCQTTKEALGGKKRSNQNDEFLVKKKDPLSMPPDYEKLPNPTNSSGIINNNSNQDDVKKIFDLNKEDSEDISNNPSTNESLEEFILKKIR
tara:strand:+ start:1506 stop:1835 length:330 start_codon:yes stop_codon:yes gene_type:complete